MPARSTGQRRAAESSIARAANPDRFTKRLKYGEYGVRLKSPTAIAVQSLALADCT